MKTKTIFQWTKRTLSAALFISISCSVSAQSVFPTNGDNVGIGTTTPTNKLQVMGDIYIDHDRQLKSNGIMNIQADDDNTGDGIINFKAGPETRMTLTDDGRLGIGITNPANPLHVKGSDNIALFETTGTTAYVRLQTNEGDGKRVEFANRPGGRATIWVNGVGDALSVLENGDVGIGTETPSNKLEVIGDIYIDDNKHFKSNGQLNIQADDDNTGDGIITFKAGTDTRITMLDNGNLGLGITNPFHKLSVDGDIFLNHDRQIRSNGIMNIQADDDNSGDGVIRFKAGTDTRMTMFDNGYVGVGTETTFGKFHIHGEDSGIESIQMYTGSIPWTYQRPRTLFVVTSNSSGTNPGFSDSKFSVLGNGNVGIGLDNPQYALHVVGRVKSNGINETSDQRLKQNIVTLDKAMDKVKALRGVSYEWRTEEFKEMQFANGTEIGLIAQEVEQVLPEVVHTDGEGYKSVAYSHLVALLIEAVKEQQEEIVRLMAMNVEDNIQMNAILEQLAELEAKVSSTPGLASGK